MARRRQSVYLQHMTAMHLILSMVNKYDDSGTVQAGPVAFNVAYVKATPFDKLVKVYDIADQEKQTWHIEMMRDMLPLVEKDVYDGFYKALSQATLSEAFMKDLLFNYNTMATVVSTNANFNLWSGEWPHGCKWIMREVVAEMLSSKV